MSSPDGTHAKALSRQDVVDLVRAGLILAVTVVAAMVVPAKVFGATGAAAMSLEQRQAAD